MTARTFFKWALITWLVCAGIIAVGMLLAVTDNPYEVMAPAGVSPDMSRARLIDMQTQMMQDGRIGAWVNITWKLLVIDRWVLPCLGLFFIALTLAALAGGTAVWRRIPPQITYHGAAEHWHSVGMHDIGNAVARATAPRQPRSPGE